MGYPGVIRTPEKTPNGWENGEIRILTGCLWATYITFCFITQTQSAKNF